ncbi:MAG: phosphatase PAP2 family protein [Endomicrobium sp.]|jgi:undecaprenyl-diphosphatase|nr:phosphatase PAP2 family protein [Endomicrobium sp.]
MKNIFIYIKILTTSFIFIFFISSYVYTCTTRQNTLLNKINYFNKCIEIIINIDHKIFKLINSTLKCRTLDYFIIILNFIYNLTKFHYSFTILIIIISILILWKYKKHNFCFNVCIFIVVLTISTISNYICKFLCARARPITRLGIENVNTILENSLYNSFPSGHTQIAVTICTFMLFIINKYRLLYIITTVLIGLERIYVGSHFPSDVIAGALLGMLITYFILIVLKYFYRL